MCIIGDNFQLHARHQKLLDQILLSIGVVGELTYAMAGLIGIASQRASWTRLTTVVMLVHLARLSEVTDEMCTQLHI
jgi:hypothetical protein